MTPPAGFRLFKTAVYVLLAANLALYALFGSANERTGDQLRVFYWKPDILSVSGSNQIGDRLDNEWGYWLVALAAAYCRLRAVREPSALRLDTQEAVPLRGRQEFGYPPFRGAAAAVP